LKKFLTVFLLLALMLGVGFLSLTVGAPVIEVEFPSPIGNQLESLPVKITIPDPNCFGYPRIPATLRVSVAGFRSRGIIIPLLLNVNLEDARSLYKFLHTPIEVETELLLPNKVGFYRVLVDVQCLYGPDYRWSYWYSFTANKELEIEPERVHIVGRLSEEKFFGYTLSQTKVYDFLQKGYSYRIQVDVVSNDEVLYTEHAGVVGTFFDPPTPLEIQNEIEEAEKSYQFLLGQFPGATLEISFVPTGTGDWRWLFSTQSLAWLEKNGIVIATNDPHWSWNPQGEFQYEYIVD